MTILSSSPSAPDSTSYPLGPLSDIGRAILELDAIRLALDRNLIASWLTSVTSLKSKTSCCPAVSKASSSRSSLTSSALIRPQSVKTSLPLADL